MSREIEGTEYLAFMRRTLRAFVRRSSYDPETLRMLNELATEAQQAVGVGMKECHNQGYSYGEIAAALGISRQAVQQRIDRQYSIDTPPIASQAPGSGGR